MIPARRTPGPKYQPGALASADPFAPNADRLQTKLKRGDFVTQQTKDMLRAEQLTHNDNAAELAKHNRKSIYRFVDASDGSAGLGPPCSGGCSASSLFRGC